MVGGQRWVSAFFYGKKCSYTCRVLLFEWHDNFVKGLCFYIPKYELKICNFECKGAVYSFKLYMTCNLPSIWCGMKIAILCVDWQKHCISHLVLLVNPCWRLALMDLKSLDHVNLISRLLHPEYSNMGNQGIIFQQICRFATLVKKNSQAHLSNLIHKETCKLPTTK